MKLLPKEEEKIGWCSSSASISGEAPARFRRGEEASMVEKRVKLLQVLGLERKSSLSEWDEGERARGALVEEEAWLTRGVREGTWC